MKDNAVSVQLALLFEPTKKNFEDKSYRQDAVQALVKAMMNEKLRRSPASEKLTLSEKIKSCIENFGKSKCGLRGADLGDICTTYQGVIEECINPEQSS